MIAPRVRDPVRAASVCTVLAVGAALGVVAACSSDGHDSRPAPGSGPPPGARSGSLVAADTLSNTTIGGPKGTVLAFRFRATWTGPVRGVRFHVIVNPPRRRGYSGGTGGRLRVALVHDAGGPRHVPGRRTLAARVVTPSREDLWPFVHFADPPRVARGRLYHVVFTNMAADPRRDYVSINAMLSYGHGEPAPPVPDGLAVLLGSATDGGATPTGWRPRAIRRGDRYVPILDVAGDRRTNHLGLGYMEAWVTASRPIGGAARVRQLLRMPAGPRAEVTGAWLRLQRARRAAAALDVRLETTGGQTLASARAPARDVSRRSPEWVHVRFSQAVSATAGTPLTLTASAARRLSYRVFPVRKGTRFGFDARTVFSDGYAQFNRGGGWTGWTQWGQRDRRDGDLQFALDIRRPRSDAP